MAITNTLTSDNDIILSERKTTTEYKIVDIYEDIKNRRVKVELTIGPSATSVPFAQTVRVVMFLNWYPDLMRTIPPVPSAFANP